MLPHDDTSQVEDVEWFEVENNGRIEFELCLIWHQDYLSLPTRSLTWIDKLRVYGDQRKGFIIVGWEVVIFVLWVERKGFIIDVKWKR